MNNLASLNLIHTCLTSHSDWKSLRTVGNRADTRLPIPPYIYYFNGDAPRTRTETPYRYDY